MITHRTLATFTRKGQRISHLGPGGSALIKTDKGHTYVRVQLYPPHPQRFEWIRESNLITKEI